ncbi:LytR/AlgR family response regulator transcription factor [Pseudoflavitalea rhizosphaerae]|uniref:LytR/AlgR family response regulator transcription factor n=1 Tax=Pseudoflavitalea rhizosphaerae TaxID=1884793 RepID=UPI000F8E4EA3|nr:response regulator [Pseudoflavitalea rhizosphaerae]
MKPLKIVLIEDHAIIRRHTAQMVTNYGDIVVGQAGAVRQGVDLLTKTNFDLLLLDINLPGGTGFDILKKISSL